MAVPSVRSASVTRLSGISGSVPASVSEQLGRRAAAHDCAPEAQPDAVMAAEVFREGHKVVCRRVLAQQQHLRVRQVHLTRQHAFERVQHRGKVLALGFDIAGRGGVLGVILPHDFGGQTVRRAVPVEGERRYGRRLTRAAAEQQERQKKQRFSHSLSLPAVRKKRNRSYFIRYHGTRSHVSSVSARTRGTRFTR